MAGLNLHVEFLYCRSWIHLIRLETGSSEYSYLCLTYWPFAFLHPREELAARVEDMEWTCSKGLGREINVPEQLICVQSVFLVVERQIMGLLMCFTSAFLSLRRLSWCHLIGFQIL